MEFTKGQLAKLKVNEIVKHPKSICIANYKGGVGKTTITTLLGYFLANRGKRVLIIDIDPQCSLSLAVGFNPSRVSKTENTIYHLVTPNKWDNIKKVNFDSYVDDIPDVHSPSKLKIIKGAFNIDELDIEIIKNIVGNEDTNKYRLFSYCRNMLNSFDNFDYVLVDCPPNKMYLTQAMLRASNFFITVTIPDKISVYGMPRLLKWVNKIPKNEKPKLLGVVINGLNRLGGNSFGTINQQNAENELLNSIEKDLSKIEKDILKNKIILSRIQQSDSIAKFLSQGDEKLAWYDFKHSLSKQESVSSKMLRLTKKIEERIVQYAQT